MKHLLLIVTLLLSAMALLPVAKAATDSNINSAFSVEKFSTEQTMRCLRPEHISACLLYTSPSPRD